MRILLTGASGYLGLHLLRTLSEAGYSVTAIIRQPSKLGPHLLRTNIFVCEGRLQDEVLFERVAQGHDVCIHAAVIWGDPREDLNLQDTVAAAKLFDAAGRAGVSRTFFVSSTAVHRPFHERMVEDDKLVTADIYGATKAAGEMFLWAACANHNMGGLVIRPGPIVGPPAFAGASFRSDSRLETFVEKARRAEPIHLEEGTGRQFVDVRDVADVILKLIRSSRVNETYICVAREITPWEWIARRIIKLTGSKSTVVVEPPPLEWPLPYFDVGKLEEHLGMVLHSQPAMDAHLAYAVRTTRGPAS